MVMLCFTTGGSLLYLEGRKEGKDISKDSITMPSQLTVTIDSKNKKSQPKKVSFLNN